MVPQAGTTYYLKEVPKSYLNPAIYVVYDTHNKYSIVRQYLMTATDDSNYLEVGLNVNGTQNVSSETLTTLAYKQVNVSGALKNETLLTRGDIVNGVKLNVTSAQDVFTSTKGGWLAITGALDGNYIASGSIFDFTPYFVTPDKVTVTASMKMKVYLRQAFFNEDNPWQKNGITKVGLPMHISLS